MGDKDSYVGSYLDAGFLEGMGMKAVVLDDPGQTDEALIKIMSAHEGEPDPVYCQECHAELPDCECTEGDELIDLGTDESCIDCGNYVTDCECESDPGAVEMHSDDISAYTKGKTWKSWPPEGLEVVAGGWKTTDGAFFKDGYLQAALDYLKTMTLPVMPRLVYRVLDEPDMQRTYMWPHAQPLLATLRTGGLLRIKEVPTENDDFLDMGGYELMVSPFNRVLVKLIAQDRRFQFIGYSNNVMAWADTIAEKICWEAWW